MCNFLSAIVFQNGDIVCNPEYTDAHEDLILACKLRDDHLSRGRFARVEFSPLGGGRKDITDLSTWQLILDEPCRPEWFDKKQVLSKLKRIVNRMIVSGHRRLLLGGCWILVGKARINTAKNCRIIKMCDYANIVAVDDNTNIDIMSGHASIAMLLGNSRVHRMFDSAAIKSVLDTAKIGDMYDNAHIDELGILASVSSMFGDSRIETMFGMSTVRAVCGNGQIDTMHDDAMIAKMFDNSRVRHMFGRSRVVEMKERMRAVKMHEHAKVFNIAKKYSMGH